MSVLSQSSNLLIGQKTQSILFFVCWRCASFPGSSIVENCTCRKDLWTGLIYALKSYANFACFYFTVWWKLRLDQQNTHWKWRFSFSSKCSVSKMLYARAKSWWQITTNSRNKFKINGARKLEKGSKNHTTEKLCDWKPMKHQKAAAHIFGEKSTSLNLLNHFLLSFLACNARCHFRYKHLSINCH